LCLADKTACFNIHNQSENCVEV